MVWTKFDESGVFEQLSVRRVDGIPMESKLFENKLADRGETFRKKLRILKLGFTKHSSNFFEHFEKFQSTEKKVSIFVFQIPT